MARIETPKIGNHVRVLGRHQHLLSDPRVRSWWEARSLRSRLSADQYLRQFGLLLERLGLTPAQVVDLAKKDADRLRDLLIRDAAKLKGDGKLDSYISKFFEGLKAYFRFHRVPFDGYPALSPIRGASLDKERIPTPEELGRVLDRLTLRGKVSALFIAHSGLRPGVLGAYQAERGLTLGDLPDLKLAKEITFTEVPFAIRVPAVMSKTRVYYTTFGSSQLTTTFLSYLEERRQEGEKLGPSSPVIGAKPGRGAAITSKENATFDTQYVTTATIVKELHKVLVASAPEGVKWRPYVLRSYCSTRLMIAEGAGKITRDLREAILGHDTGVSGRYNVGKTWGSELLKEARAQYKRAEPYLLTMAKAEEGSENATRVIRLLLEARGVPTEKLDKLDIGAMSDEEIVALIKTVGASPATEKKAVQKAVSVEQVPKLLEEGWEFIAPLNGSMAVLRAPQ